VVVFEVVSVFWDGLNVKFYCLMYIVRKMVFTVRCMSK